MRTSILGTVPASGDRRLRDDGPLQVALEGALLYLWQGNAPDGSKISSPPPPVSTY